MLLELSQQTFHFRAGVLIALPISGVDPAAQQRFGFLRAVLLSQRLCIHLITWNVIGISSEQRLEVRFGCGQVSFAEAFEGDAVAGKRIVGILRQKLFQFLPTGFVLFGHGSLAYYTWRSKSGQKPQEGER